MTEWLALCSLLGLALGASALGAAPESAAAPGAGHEALPRLRVSENHRFLVTEDGRPFFYLADTAWELFHRLSREEAERYLADRAARGFTVIQAVAMAELDGLTVPSRDGFLPLVDRDPGRPDVRPGPRNDYGDFVDEVLAAAEAKGLYVGLLPTWGRYVTSDGFNGKVDGIFTAAKAQAYGHNSVWQMYAPGRAAVLNPKAFRYDALDAPSARQMGYLRGLMESRPVLGRVPDQSLLASDPGDDVDHIAATRGDGYAMVYTPDGKPFKVHLDRLSGKQVQACWYDPRTGKVRVIGQFDRQGDREFVPPGTPGVGNDWVLVLDDPQAGRGPPGHR